MTEVPFSIGDFTKAAGEAVSTIDKLIELPKKTRDAYREFRLDGAITQLNERLYGRYLLIEAIERFGDMHGPEEDFKEIVAIVRKRIDYLKTLNKDLESRLKTVSPKLAADLVKLTNDSISVYEAVVAVENPRRMEELAPRLAAYLKAVANHLEHVNSKLKELASKA